MGYQRRIRQKSGYLEDIDPEALEPMRIIQTMAR